MKKLSFVLSVLLLAVAIMPAVVLAQAQPPTTGIGQAPVGGVSIGETGGISDVTTLVGLIMGLVNWFAWIVAIAAVVFGLYSGVLFITAAGDEAKVKKAKDILIYSIIGIIVAILAFSIVAIAKSISGL